MMFISRDPYLFFIKVISWASKPGDTLAYANFELPSHDLLRPCESSPILSELKNSPLQIYISVQ